jgi:hypothetical protein
VSPNPRAHSAYHESGHVIAARVLGIAVESVTIIPDENCERGEVFAAALTVLVEPLKLHDNASVETAALILLAGEASQRQFCPRSLEKHHIEADRATLAAFVDERDIPRLQRKAEEMIRESWPEIEALAGLLLERGRIDFLAWKAGYCPRARGRLILALTHLEKAPNWLPTACAYEKKTL